MRPNRCSDPARRPGNRLAGAGAAGARHWLARAAAAAGVLAGLGAAAPARAHDTWLAWRAGAAPGELGLALGTGHAYPRMESPVPWRGVAEAACRAPGAAPVPMAVRRQARDALWLAAPGLPAQGDLSCWAHTRPQPITLAPAQVVAYLDEVNAPPAVRAAWAAQQAAGQPWREVFSKHARLERYAGGAGEATGRAPAGMPLELVVLGAAPVVGAPITLQAWREGQPAAGLALQLLNDGAPAGLWVRTDAQGQVRVRLPLPGPWLARGTDLAPPAASDPPGTPWVSRFVTLAFEPLAAAP